MTNGHVLWKLIWEIFYTFTSIWEKFMKINMTSALLYWIAFKLYLPLHNYLKWWLWSITHSSWNIEGFMGCKDALVYIRGGHGGKKCHGMNSSTYIHEDTYFRDSLISRTFMTNVSNLHRSPLDLSSWQKTI